MMRILVLDTNNVYDSRKQGLFSRDFEQKLTECRSIYEHKVFLPRLAYCERHFQLKNHWHTMYKDCTRYAKELHAGLKMQLLQMEVSPGMIDVLLQDEMDAAMLRNGVEIEEAPIATIDWERVINDSVYRNPPFSGEGSEKGFRDMVIVETAVAVASRSRYDPNERVAILSGDGRFKAAVEARLHSFDYATSFHGIDDYLSHLKAERESEHKDAHRVYMLTTEASRQFYIPSNNDCLYHRVDVPGQIRRMFADKLDYLPDLNAREFYLGVMTQLNQMEPARMIVERTDYRGLTQDGSAHRWVSLVKVGTLFRGAGAYLFIPVILVRIVTFEVEWSAQLSDSNVFSNHSIMAIRFIGGVLEEATKEVIEPFRFKEAPDTLNRPQLKRYIWGA